MRFFLRILSGAAGLLGGWFLTGIISINMTEPRDLGDFFVAFVMVGPIGGLVGLGACLWLFSKLVVVRKPGSPLVVDSAKTP